MVDTSTQMNTLISGLQDYEANQKKYADRLATFTPSAPSADIFDLATSISQGLSAQKQTDQPNSIGGGFALGFNAFSQQVKKERDQYAKEKNQIALQAAQLAMQDEQKATEFLNQYNIKRIDAANKKVDYITFEYEEEQEDGSFTMVQQTLPNIASRKDDIDEIINNKKGRKVSDAPQTTINMPGKTNFADEQAIKGYNEDSKSYEAKSKAADAIVDSVNQAFILAQQIKSEGGTFGPLSKRFLGVKEFISETGFGEFMLGEAEAAIAPQKALNQLSMGFTMAIVSQTKGAISDREMNLFIQASPTLGSTEEGYLKQLELLERLARRDKVFYQDYIDRRIELSDKGMEGERLGLQLNKFTSTWSDENPLFTPKEVKFLEKQISSGEGIASDFVPQDFKKAFDKVKAEQANRKALLPRMDGTKKANQAIYDALKIGDQYIGSDGALREKQ